MANKVTVSVDLHGVEEDLISLGPKIARRLFRRALSIVGQLWVDDVKTKVPVDTGTLRDSIDYVVRTSPSKNEGSVTVGPTYDKTAMKNAANTTESPGVYGMFVEFGLKSKKYKKQPYMRPTFDATAESIITLFAASLREDLEEAIKG